MGCLRVDKIIDYLTEPLRKCLKVITCVVVYAQTIKSLNLFFFRMKILMSEKQLLFVLQSYMTLTLNWPWNKTL